MKCITLLAVLALSLAPRISWPASLVVPAGKTAVDTLIITVRDFALPSPLHTVATVDVELSGGRLLLRPVLATLATPDAGTPDGLERDFDALVGRLPEGSYPVDLLSPAGGNALATTTLTVLPHADMLRQNLGGHYWLSTEPGSGLMFWHRPRDDAMYGVWFTYRDAKPYWMALVKPRVVREHGMLVDPAFEHYEMRGPPIAPVFDPSHVSAPLRLPSLGGTPADIWLKDRRVAFQNSSAYCVYGGPCLNTLEFVPNLHVGKRDRMNMWRFAP